MLSITVAAQNYFVGLLENQKREGAEIRVYIVDAGTDLARCGICFCFSDSFQSSDVIINFDYVAVRVEQKIISFLKDAIIDVLICGLNYQLIFKAPNAKKPLYNSTSDAMLLQKNGAKIETVHDNCNNVSLENNINNVIEFQINPQLSVHGGKVSLVNITDDLLVFLRFSGGCNGCSMASYTVKLNIERTLKNLFPQIKGVCDITEHRHGHHSYY